MDVASVKKYYDDAAKTYDDRRIIPAMELGVLQQFVSFLEEGQIQNLVDLGCGAGGIAESLASKGFTVDAIDFSISMIETAKLRHAHPNVNYYVSTFLEFLDSWHPDTPVGVVLAYALVHASHEEITELFCKLSLKLVKNSYLFVAIHVGEETVVPSSLNNEMVSLTAWDKDIFLNMIKSHNFEIMVEKTRPPDEWEFNNQKLCVVLRATEQKDRKRFTPT